MASIQNLQGSDKIKDSRAVINQNFSNLNDDKAEKSGVRDSSYNYAFTTGSGNVYAITLSPAPSSYAAGIVVNLKANHTNTGPSTLNVNGLGAKSILKNKDYELEKNDIKANGVYSVMYDGANFQMISQLGKKYEAKDLKASVQSPPDLTLYVQAGSVKIEGLTVCFAGGNSSAFTVPTTNPRIDLLVLKSDATLEIIQGTEAVSPSAPTYPSDKFVICEVYNRATQSVIKESSDGSNGYIYKDVRSYFHSREVGEVSNFSDVIASRALDGTVYQNTSGKWRVVTISARAICGADSGVHATASIGVTSSPASEISKMGGITGAGYTSGNFEIYTNMSFLVPPNWYYKIVTTAAGTNDKYFDGTHWWEGELNY